MVQSLLIISCTIQTARSQVNYYFFCNDIVHSSSAGNTVTMHSMREWFAMTMWNEVQEEKCRLQHFSLTAKTVSHLNDLPCSREVF